jgi:hypothetical protein
VGVGSCSSSFLAILHGGRGTALPLIPVSDFPRPAQGVVFAVIASLVVVIGFVTYYLVLRMGASRPISGPAINLAPGDFEIAGSETAGGKQSIPYSLPNGTEIRKRLHLNGYGELSVENGTLDDAVVHLVELNRHKTIRTFYVQSGMTFNERQISHGLYGIYFSTGRDWNIETKSFNENADYSQFGRNVDYSETKNASAGKIEFNTYKITLQPVQGGNVTTFSSDKDTFDKMMNQETSEQAGWMQGTPFFEVVCFVRAS